MRWRSRALRSGELIDPGSTAKRLLLWGRAANGVVVQLTGTLKGGPAFRCLDA